MSLLSSSAAVLLATSAVAVAIGVLPTRVDAQSAQVGAAAEGTASRPFKFRASDEALADLKRRIKATRWPSRELVADDSQGVRLATMQKLADYWANQYDWRKVEERLSALPQFVTTIDGVDIHFIHVKIEGSERAAGDRHTRLARIDHRADQDHRAVDQPDRSWWERGRRLRRRHSLDPGVRLLRQAHRTRMGSRSASRAPGQP